MWASHPYRSERGLHLEIQSKRQSCGPSAPSAFELVVPPVRRRETATPRRPGTRKGDGVRAHPSRPAHLFLASALGFRLAAAAASPEPGGPKLSGGGFRRARVRASTEPVLDISTRPGGVQIAVPHLPEGLGPQDVIAAQRVLLDRFLEQERGRTANLLVLHAGGRGLLADIANAISPSTITWTTSPLFEALRPNCSSVRSSFCCRPIWSSPAA